MGATSACAISAAGRVSAFLPVEAHQIIVLRLVARKWDVSSVVGGV